MNEEKHEFHPNIQKEFGIKYMEDCHHPTYTKGSDGNICGLCGIPVIVCNDGDGHYDIMQK